MQEVARMQPIRFKGQETACVSSSVNLALMGYLSPRTGSAVCDPVRSLAIDRIAFY